MPIADRNTNIAAYVTHWKKPQDQKPEAKSLKLRLMSITTGLTYRKYYNYTLFKLQHTKLTISSRFIRGYTHWILFTLNVCFKIHWMCHRVLTNMLLVNYYIIFMYRVYIIIYTKNTFLNLCCFHWLVVFFVFLHSFFWPIGTIYTTQRASCISYHLFHFIDIASMFAECPKN